MRALKTGSFWLSLFEQLVYIAPTLGTAMYYYFSEIEKSVSWSSKMSFGLAIVMLVLLIVYKRVAKRKVDNMRQAIVQSKTDLRNGVGDPDKIIVNIEKDSVKLDELDRAYILVSLLAFASAVYILERAAIGLTTLVFIAIASVAAGMGIHLGVLKLEAKEMLKSNTKSKE